MNTLKSTLLAPITGLECSEESDGNFVVYVGTGVKLDGIRALAARR